MQKQLAQALMLGDGMPQITARIQGVAQMSLRQARRVARTETMRAMNEGRYVAAGQASEEHGIIMDKRWIATNDERTRGSHAAMHGQTVGQHEIFTLPSGETAHFPLDDSLSAGECINCRCIIIFVVRSSRQSENYQNLVAKNEDITYTRMYQEAQAENANIRSNSNGGGIISSGVNNPIEMTHPVDVAFKVKKLDERQQRVLDELPSFGSSAVFNKNDVSMFDLSALTAATGDEFSMFARKSERLVVRGNDKQVPLSLEELRNLSNDGYRWSGHTHPGTSPVHLNVSSGDLEALRCFRHETSAVYNSLGRRAVYDVNGKFEVIYDRSRL